MSDGSHNLSEDLLQKLLALKDFLSLAIWESFSSDNKAHLLKFLPNSLTQTEKEDTVRRLFSGSNLTAFSSICCSSSSGNPIDNLYNKIQSGFFSKKACLLRKCQKKAIVARSKYLKSHYYNELLKEIIVSQRCHLSAVTFPNCFELVKYRGLGSLHIDRALRNTIIKSVTNIYHKILSDVRRDVSTSHNYPLEDVLSSDSDSLPDAEIPRSVLLDRTPSVTSSRIKEMLIQHKKRRLAKINSPDLAASNIKLIEVCSRAYGTPKKTAGFLRKRRPLDGSSYSRAKKFKSSRLNKEFKKEKKAVIVREKRAITSPSCYFELLRDVINLTSDKSTESIQLLVFDWLASAEASRYDWTNNFGNDNELIKSSLEFLSHTPVEENDAKPFLQSKEGVWIWFNSLSKDVEEKILQRLCQEWMEKVPPHLLVSSADGADSGNLFHLQERRRFTYAHQAFVYNIDGSRFPVPPVKGTVGPTKEGRVAREHCLLKSERPPQVTLLALTRDAVARLPGRRGTRSVICDLVRESQYLAPGISDAQVTAAVSGALDRLHYEPDPCVRYDASAKVWLYLHADRSPEDLERIHAEQLGAPKRKKERLTRRSRLKNSDSRRKHRDNENSTLGEGGDGTKENSPQETSRCDGAAPSMPLPSGGADVAKESAPPKRPSVRTIQVSQQQLLEMTRSIMRHGSTGDARELLINHVDKNSQGKFSEEAASQSPAGLKLILKPTGGPSSQKPSAELVRVVDPPPRSNQQVLSTSALRRLTEQLSAMSSRPIKIIQRNVAPSPRVMTVTAQSLPKNKPFPPTNAPVFAPSSVAIPRRITPLDNAQRSPKTVYISRVAKSEPMSPAPSRNIDEGRILHIVHRGPHNTTRTIEVGSTGGKTSSPNVQTAPHPARAPLHILSAGPVLQPGQAIKPPQVGDKPESSVKD